MSFVSIVAFCTLMSAGPVSPIPPRHCVWVEAEKQHEKLDECVPATNAIANGTATSHRAQVMLFDQYGYAGDVQWYTWCIPETERRNFYRHFGVTELKDIPIEV